MSFNYQFRSKSIVSFWKPDKPHPRSLAQIACSKELEKQKTYTGLVTKGSQKRLTKALEQLMVIAKDKPLWHNGREYRFKVNFITLTIYSFGQRINARDAHKACLEKFIRWMRGQGVTAYIWKAELQSNRKDCHQLHYHITSDCYLDHVAVRQKWNELQREAGYLDSFYEKFGRWNPPSTEVKATHTKKNLIAYLKKQIISYAKGREKLKAEMAKSIQNGETIEGKLWDCSLNLKKANFFEVRDFADVTAKIAEGVVKGQLEKKEFDRCSVFEVRGLYADSKCFLPYVERLFYEQHIENIRNYERKPPTPNIVMLN